MITLLCIFILCRFLQIIKITKINISYTVSTPFRIEIQCREKHRTKHNAQYITHKEQTYEENMT